MGQAQHSSVPGGTILSPVVSNRGPAWQSGIHPFRRSFSPSSSSSLPVSSALPHLLLLAGIHPHSGQYQLRSSGAERARLTPAPLMNLPMWPSPPALFPASFTLSPLAYSPSGLLLPFPPLMPPASFTLSSLAYIPTAPISPFYPSAILTSPL